jgi:hypothetical protein
MSVQEFFEYLQREIAEGRLDPGATIYAEYAEEFAPISHVVAGSHNSAFIHANFS